MNTDERLTEALEASPRVEIADDFAARVMCRLPARRLLPYRMRVQASIGRRVSVAAGMALLLAIAGFAMQTGGSNAMARMAVEWVFAAEFVVLTVWLSLRPGTLR
jgi:hypothetical protein